MSTKKGTLLSLFRTSKPLSYRSGEIIIRAGDTPSGVYCIEKGFVKVYSIEQSGEENIHIIYKEGELFPIMWVLQNVLKDLYYQALGKTTLRKLPREKFIEYIRQAPHAHMELLAKITSIIDVHADRIDNLEIARSYPRIISRLLFLAQRFGIKKGKQVTIEVPLKHEDIASSINMTRETASRDLEKLKRRGLIDYKTNSILIKNLEGLKEELVKTYHRERL